MENPFAKRKHDSRDLWDTSPMPPEERWDRESVIPGEGYPFTEMARELVTPGSSA